MFITNFIIFALVIIVFRLLSSVNETKRKLKENNEQLEELFSTVRGLNGRIQQLEIKDKVDQDSKEQDTAEQAIVQPIIKPTVQPMIQETQESQPTQQQTSELKTSQPIIAPPPLPQQVAQVKNSIVNNQTTPNLTATATPRTPTPQPNTATPTRNRPKPHKHKPPQHSRSRPQRPAQPNAIEKGFAFAKTWLTTGNIPVKVGMLVLLSAVIAFLRYATTMGWLHVPIEMKLLGVAVTAIATLIFAWKKRDTKRSFALVMQGGSIGVLLLVIFSAVKMYSLMSAPVGFILSLAFILLTAILSIQQNAKVLAIMAIFAGFLAPIWLSDGSGNHVILFSYYAILNVGIFVIALLKPWRELSLLGFVFTYVIGSTWGGLNYTSEHFATTEPFVILFFFFYLFIPLRFAQQTNKLLEEGTKINHDEFYHKYRLSSGLLFGTPLVTFIAQVALLDNNDHLALTCVAMGIVYGVLAFILRGYSSRQCSEQYSEKRFADEYGDENMFATLQRAYTGLSAIFFTLAVPIGLSAKATATIFALEGAGAVWLGARANPRRRKVLTWLAGGFLQISSAVAFMVAYADNEHFWRNFHPKFAFMNEVYLSGVLLAISALLCAWFSYRAVKVAEERVSKQRESEEIGNNDVQIWLTNGILIGFARIFFIASMLWWLSINFYEIARMPTNSLQRLYIYMIFLIITAVLLLRLYLNKKGYQDSIVWRMASLLLMTMGYFALAQWIGGQISEGWTIITWLIVAIGGWLVWRGLQQVRSTWLEFAIAIWLISIMTSISTLIHAYISPSDLNESGWYWGAIFAVWIGFALVNNYRPQAIAWLGQRQTNSNDNTNINPWQTMVSWVTVAVLACVFLRVATLSGAGGWWLPMLNSLDGLQIILAGVLIVSMRQSQKEFRSIAMASLFLIVISIITLRGVYHYATASDIVWGISMFSKAVIQMALTVVWSILGVVTWIVGSKRLSKPIWLLGAVLMTVVLLKLILIDRGHLGNLFGIGSFFAYGVLCVIVGYFAPIPQIGEEVE